MKIKQLLEAKIAPNLKGFQDISEYILRENDCLSENEVEDIMEDDVKSKGGEKQANKMTVKLHVTSKTFQINIKGNWSKTYS